MAERNNEKMKKPKIPDSEKKPFFLFAKKQGGVPLTKGQIKDIKLRRKLLRQEMKEMGIKDRKEFEVMASGMNLYFDKSGKFATMRLLFSGKGGLLLLCPVCLYFLFRRKRVSPFPSVAGCIAGSLKYYGQTG